jgi:type I restriction enzyme S subunit
MPKVNRDHLFAFEFQMPSIREQQRIVGILDDAFDGIASAKANAEKGVQNARAIFDSHREVVLTRKASGWTKRRLGDVCVLQRGYDLPTGNRMPGDIPVVSSSGIIARHDASAAKGPCVATGRSGSIGKVFFVEEDCWPLNTVLYVKDFHGNAPRFVFHLLNELDLAKLATGTGVPTLNRNFVHDVVVSIPASRDVQTHIACQLDALQSECQQLETINAHKLAALDALKKSLLHDAFSGNL